MRLRPPTRGQNRLQRADLGIRNRSRLALKGHESQYTGSPQNTQAVASVEIHEDIAREQGHFQFFQTILPATQAAVQREKAAPSLLPEMTGNQLFVPRTDRYGVPSRDRHMLFGISESFVRHAAR